MNVVLLIIGCIVGGVSMLSTIVSIVYTGISIHDDAGRDVGKGLVFTLISAMVFILSATHQIMH